MRLKASKVYVPVNTADELPTELKVIAYGNAMGGIHTYYSAQIKDLPSSFAYWLKETEKILLTKEELYNIISNAVRHGQSSVQLVKSEYGRHGINIPANTAKEYINNILELY